MVSKPTGKPVGRPRKPRPPPPSHEQKLARKFLKDPDRYGVALLDAMLALEMGSERACAMGIAAMAGRHRRRATTAVAGAMGGSSPIGNGSAPRKGSGPGRWRAGQSTLRVKQGRIRSAEEGRWRTAMAIRFHARASAPVIRRPEVRHRCVRGKWSAKASFARRVMLPMFAAKFPLTRRPNFRAKSYPLTKPN